tara:strand:+ start:375 stop:671 length:297 start_codon:yes stop_codon:yes gene_type:complete
MKFPDYKELSREEFEKQILKYWHHKANKLLLGRKIVKVEYMTPEETEECYWHNSPVLFKLDNGVWVTPQSDDEGNDGGVISTYNTKTKKSETLPVMRY